MSASLGIMGGGGGGGDGTLGIAVQKQGRGSVQRRGKGRRSSSNAGAGGGEHVTLPKLFMKPVENLKTECSPTLQDPIKLPEIIP